MTTILERMTDLTACIVAQITVDGSPEPCWSGIVAGQAVDLGLAGVDCDGGMVWVRLAQAYPSQSIGQVAQSLGNCSVGTGFDLEMGIIRPIELTEEGPDPAQALADAEQQMKDMQTMRRALVCCSSFHPKDFILGSYQPYGPLGGVLGGTWTIYAGL